MIMSATDLRARCRIGMFAGSTAGHAPGNTQGNLVILPSAEAGEFLEFCHANPKPCPLIAMSDPGDPTVPRLGQDIDIRTDLPGYRIWSNGEVKAEVSDIRDFWRDDLVSFVLGCSFGFEAALIQAGIKLDHIREGRNVAMYDTNIPCTPAGQFRGNMVVSMRPISNSQISNAISISAEFPMSHGKPVQIGEPEKIGISDLSHPNYGDATPFAVGKTAVFWACGVTPQALLRNAKPPFCITHAPGKMLVTDVSETDLMGDPN